MGKAISKMFKKAFGKKKLRVLLLGLDNSGKTTILNQLQGKPLETIPTQGFNVETVKLGPVQLLMWDVSGQDKARPLWRHYYRGTSGIVFVVDANDADRMALARKELHGTLREEELEYACVLILANKMDLPNALSVDEVSKRLQLEALGNREFHIHATNAYGGQGLKEGFEWLTQHMKPI